MTDMTAADTLHVCDQYPTEADDLVWWKWTVLGVFVALTVGFAVIGFFDIGLRYLFDIWW